MKWGGKEALPGLLCCFWIEVIVATWYFGNVSTLHKSLWWGVGGSILAGRVMQAGSEGAWLCTFQFQPGPLLEPYDLGTLKVFLYNFST